MLQISTVPPVSLADYTPKLNEGISTLTQRKEMFMKRLIEIQNKLKVPKNQKNSLKTP